MKAMIRDSSGGKVEVPILPTLYQDAHKANLTVAQFLNTSYPTDAEKYGTVFNQVCAASGLVMGSDKNYGIRAPSLAQVLEGTSAINAGAITQDGVPASRILFPAVFLEVMENALQNERTSQPMLFEEMIAISDTIAGARFEQPILTFTNANTMSQGVAQLALPASMLRITAADVARKIPVFSIGMEISDEAARVINVDLTALTLGRQVELERDSRVEGYISALVTGDADLGMPALSSTTSTTYDSLASGGVLTQKAWIKFLANKRRKRKLTHVICDIDTALKIESRTGRPSAQTIEAMGQNYNASGIPLNLGIGDVKIFIVEPGVVAANTIVGLDSRYAIRRVRNSEAEYQAAEAFALKKSTAMRFDFGEIVYRLYEDAFDVMTIA